MNIVERKKQEIFFIFHRGFVPMEKFTMAPWGPFVEEYPVGYRFVGRCKR